MRLVALPARGLVPGRGGLLPLRLHAGLRRRQLPAGPGRMPESAMRAWGRVPRPGQRVSRQPGAQRWRGCGVGWGRGGGRVLQLSARLAPGSGATARTRATRACTASRRCWSARRRPARTTRPAWRASGASAASAGQVRVRVLARAAGWARPGAAPVGVHLCARALSGPSGVCACDGNFSEPVS